MTLNWNLPLLLAHDELAILLYDEYLAEFHQPLFNSVYGGFANPWNGGRIATMEDCDFNILSRYWDRDIKTWLTFSKFSLEKWDLTNWDMLNWLSFYGDLPCNYIVANLKLKDIIKKACPKALIKCSINHFYAQEKFCDDIRYINFETDYEKIKREREELDYIMNLLYNGFDFVVPRCEAIPFVAHSLPKEFLPQIEILVNNHCVYNCSYRKEHIRYIENNNQFINDVEPYPCYWETHETDFDDTCLGDNSLVLSPEMVWYYATNDVCYFKLEGRDKPTMNVLKEIFHYMFGDKPSAKEKEFIAYMRQKVYRDIILKEK